MVAISSLVSLMRRRSSLAVLLGLLAVLSPAIAIRKAEQLGAHSGRGWDSGYDAAALADVMRNNMDGWMRLRGHWLSKESLAAADPRKGPLRRLAAYGVQTIVLGKEGGWRVRRNHGTVPSDLQEAFARGAALTHKYGEAIDAWEIENEPDLIYVSDNPETYAAYLKTFYLGLHAGAERTVGWSSPSKHLATRTQRLGPRSPRVVMAPMGLPPGPYFEALQANGLLSYTDAFNYHNYGYAPDFSGVYQLWEEAVAEAAAPTSASNKDQGTSNKASIEVLGVERRTASATIGNPVPSSQHLVTRSLPVFMTEYGYAQLSGVAAETNEGRVRQWRYFRDVYRQIQDLRIEAPMVFKLLPYFEQGSREYGLTVAAQPPLATSDQNLATRNPSGQQLETRNTSDQKLATSVFTAGGVEFTPADFGATEVEPWMRDIGRKIGEFEASPAMAWLMNQPALSESRPWVVRVEPPCPVVIDFIAGDGMFVSKNFRGNFLIGQTDTGWRGMGDLRVYNFHRSAVEGTLVVQGVAAEPMRVELRLLAGEMKSVPLDFAYERSEFDGVQWTAEFYPRQARLGRAVFSSWYYPNYAVMAERPVADFAHTAEEARQNLRSAETRFRADEEEQLFTSGRWRLSKGVSVEEKDGVWRFTVTGFPDEPLRPAVAELPLRDGFAFPRRSFFRLNHRLVPRTLDRVEPVAEPRSDPELSSLSEEAVGLFLRTTSGNLYMMSGPFAVGAPWRDYTQAAQNFNLFSFGRMNLPWRFFENEPAALVFQFRPRLLPATYEFKDVRVVEFSAAEPR